MAKKQRNNTQSYLEEYFEEERWKEEEQRKMDAEAAVREARYQKEQMQSGELIDYGKAEELIADYEEQEHLWDDWIATHETTGDVTIRKQRERDMAAEQEAEKEKDTNQPQQEQTPAPETVPDTGEKQSHARVNYFREMMDRVRQLREAGTLDYDSTRKAIMEEFDAIGKKDSIAGKENALKQMSRQVNALVKNEYRFVKDLDDLRADGKLDADAVKEAVKANTGIEPSSMETKYYLNAVKNQEIEITDLMKEYQQASQRADAVEAPAGETPDEKGSRIMEEMHKQRMSDLEARINKDVPVPEEPLKTADEERAAAEQKIDSFEQETVHQQAVTEDTAALIAEMRSYIKELQKQNELLMEQNHMYAGKANEKENDLAASRTDVHKFKDFVNDAKQSVALAFRKVGNLASELTGHLKELGRGAVDRITYAGNRMLTDIKNDHLERQISGIQKSIDGVLYDYMKEIEHDTRTKNVTTALKNEMISRENAKIEKRNIRHAKRGEPLEQTKEKKPYSRFDLGSIGEAQETLRLELDALNSEKAGMQMEAISNLLDKGRTEEAAETLKEMAPRTPDFAIEQFVNTDDRDSIHSALLDQTKTDIEQDWKTIEEEAQKAYEDQLSPETIRQAVDDIEKQAGEQEQSCEEQSYEEQDAGSDFEEQDIGN